jgi:RHS repeat-associated protein
MFTGREYDAETGLYHYRERAYSPQIGRFLQTDPLAIDDENTYTYCYNDPVNWVDPYGLQATLPVTVVGIGGVIPGTGGYLPPITICKEGLSFQGQDMSKKEGEDVKKGGKRKDEKKRPARTPAKNKPNSKKEFPDGKGGKTVREYGPDGRAKRDIDYGHNHGKGDPHQHGWDWSDPNNPRGPGIPL